MSTFNDVLRRMGGTVSPQLGGGGSTAAPYVPGPSASSFGQGPMTGAQTGIGAGSSAMSPMSGPMNPLMASLLGTGVEMFLPGVINAGANIYDRITGAGNEDGSRIAANEKMFADLQAQRNAVMDEAIRRAKATAGQAIGANMAMSGAAGLSSFNPVLAAQARQGEAQIARGVSGLELQKNQDQADYQSSRIAAINAQLSNLRGTEARRRNARSTIEKAVG